MLRCRQIFLKYIIDECEEQACPTPCSLMTLILKKEIHHDGKIMRAPDLYLSGRTG